MLWDAKQAWKWFGEVSSVIKSQNGSFFRMLVKLYAMWDAKLSQIRCSKATKVSFCDKVLTALFVCFRKLTKSLRCGGVFWPRLNEWTTSLLRCYRGVTVTRLNMWKGLYSLIGSQHGVWSKELHWINVVEPNRTKGHKKINNIKNSK